MASITREEPHYFGAGPAALPTSVLQQAAQDLINFKGLGLGIGEISHRDKNAINVIDETKSKLIELLEIPDTHEVFFLQGGATSGFSAIATNLLAHHAKKTGKRGKASYVITGGWSSKAYEEINRFGIESEILSNSKEIYGSFGKIQPFEEWNKPSEDSAFVYYCDNETVHGVEFPFVPQYENVEIVADLSSNILSKKIDVSKFGVIYAGAQKNVGLAGITIYIIKKSLLDQANDQELRDLSLPITPISFHFPTVVKQNSLYNTIPVFTVQILNLVLGKLIKDGGLNHQEALNLQKSSNLYDILDKYSDFYSLPVDKEFRSKMNVIFKTPSVELEDKFLEGAKEVKLTGLKGHRSVGGLRASLYNAVTVESTELLINFVERFAQENK
ncbi:hypothetical protein WICMUC_001631 [Wickerhamomyces mucosus]|uniref:Phosphoserine aminotransferase n=1 Tax=Wickerhamomyces mucosus TaxID=1378264 RepID=A0A9P8PU60_9ASCO|nr:hypothetical protein WICMUC_001631 [Wickerhamomyces mucosus]